MKYLWCLVAVVLLPLNSFGQQWLTDYGVAREHAVKQKKPMILIVGHDSQDFEKTDLSGFVKVKLDRERDATVIAALQVQTFPSVVISGPGPDLLWRSTTPGNVSPEKLQKLIEPPPVVTTPSALDEVNARRASKGLYPYIEDPLLTQGAYNAANFRAANLIAGHTSNDFGYLPAGVHASGAGCAAWEPSWGWGSCCTDDSGPRYAGAGWAWGRDGRRYMHLFVR